MSIKIATLLMNLWPRRGDFAKNRAVREFIFIFFSIFVLAFSGQISADSAGGVKQKLLEANVKVSKWLDKKARKLDLFLSGRKFTEKINQTQATISLESVWHEGGEVETAPSFSMSLRLPNVEKRYQVMFSSYDADERHRSSYSRRQPQISEQRKYGASIGFFKRLGDIKTGFQPRIELEDPLMTSYLLRFEGDTTNSKTNSHSLDWRLELFASSEKGTGEFFAINHTYSFNPIWALVSTFEEEYQDGGNLFKTLEGISLEQNLTDKMGIGYSLAVRSNSRPAFHLTEYSASVSFAHTVYNEIFRYAVVANQSFAKVRSFKGASSIGITVDLIF